MSDIEIPAAHNELRLAATLALLDAGPGPSRMLYYPLPRAALGAEPAGPLLADVPLASPAGTIAGGLLTLSASAEAIVMASGDVGWCRIVNGAGALVLDSNVAEEADPPGTASVVIAARTVYAGGVTRLLGGVFA